MENLVDSLDEDQILKLRIRENIDEQKSVGSECNISV